MLHRLEVRLVEYELSVNNVTWSVRICLCLMRQLLSTIIILQNRNTNLFLFKESLSSRFIIYVHSKPFKDSKKLFAFEKACSMCDVNSVIVEMTLKKQSLPNELMNKVTLLSILCVEGEQSSLWYSIYSIWKENIIQLTDDL